MDNRYYEIIWDEAELKKFYDTILARKALLPNEVRYCSLSARNKYLDEEERKVYHLGRSEMFGKQVVRHETWEAYLQAVRRYECNVQGYLTKSGLPYPQKVMVCYANINPSDVLKTIGEMNKAIDENKDALVFAAIKGSKAGVDDAFHKIRKVEDKLISLYARNIGTKTWVDFDFDIDKSFVPVVAAQVDAFLRTLGDVDHHWVDTKGGAHMLLLKDHLKFNPGCLSTIGYIALWYANQLDSGVDPIPFSLANADVVNQVKSLTSQFEIIQNSNQMVPCPGTLQGGYPVRMLGPSDIPELPASFETTLQGMVEAFKAGKNWGPKKTKQE